MAPPLPPLTRGLRLGVILALPTIGTGHGAMILDNVVSIASGRRRRLKKTLEGFGVDLLEDGGFRMTEGSDIADLLHVWHLMRSQWPACADSASGTANDAVLRHPDPADS